jgi:hypothetical protein
MTVQDDELAELRERVDCRTVLERDGWELDAQASTRHAVKYRGGAGRIVIVTHEGKGWFDPLNDRRGDVLALAQHVWGGTLGHARKNLRPLAGIAPKLPPVTMVRADGPTMTDADEVWAGGPKLRPGSAGWAYLTRERGLPAATVERAVQLDALREGVLGTVWMAHRGSNARVTGWEMRGPRYKGYSKGGGKALLVLGEGSRVGTMMVTESGIDALSLATLDGWRPGVLYASTGGGWGPATVAALVGCLERHGLLIAATDNGTGGDLLARRLDQVAQEHGYGTTRNYPAAKDWNEQLRAASVP